MIILAIEATCDDTSFAILNQNKVLSFMKKTQIIHQNYRGVIPELAARYHFNEYSTLLKKVIQNANLSFFDIDYVAYSSNPGLPSCLHICKSIAQSISLILNIPLIAVDHLFAHLFSSLINKEVIDFKNQTNLGLVMSGGHTSLYLINNFEPKLIGKTVDDAIGECFDKVAVILELGFPWGANIEKLAKGGKLEFNFSLPKKLGFNFSYSGLKTATLKFSKALTTKTSKKNLAFSFQHFAFIQVISVLKKAILKFNINNIFLGGGVIQNEYFKKLIKENFKNSNLNFFFPEPKYCADNAVMICYYAWLKIKDQNNSD